MRFIYLTCFTLFIHACTAIAPVVTEPVSPETPKPITLHTPPITPPQAPAGTSALTSPSSASENVSIPHLILIQPPSPTTPLTPTQAKIDPVYQQTTRNGITLSLVSFDDRAHQLRVADQQNGPGSQWSTAQSAAAEHNGIAAINAGFFTPEGKPLGLLVANGTRRGSLNQSSLGSGMIHFSSTSASIFRKGLYLSSKHNSGNLLQAGPMLAEKSDTISGLSKTNSRHRSFIAWDGGHHWLIGHASPCTLDQLSHAIAGKTLAGVKITTAINLDGGRSSDLWAGNKVRNGGKTHRTFINKTVRNYLVLVKR